MTKPFYFFKQFFTIFENAKFLKFLDKKITGLKPVILFN